MTLKIRACLLLSLFATFLFAEEPVVELASILTPSPRAPMTL